MNPYNSDANAKFNGLSEKDMSLDFGNSLYSQDMSSLDLKSVGMFNSSNDDKSENSPDKLLNFAYMQAIKDEPEGAKRYKFLRHYHKCLYALIKVMTKRMKLFYQNMSQEDQDLLEDKF